MWPGAYPTGELHLVMDNYATHKRVEVRDWLAANPRVHFHFTPTSGSWLNLVEVWFSIIEKQALHRGTFGSVRDLNAKIREFINGWNPRSHPFIWTKPADEIIDKINRKHKHISTTPHGTVWLEEGRAAQPALPTKSANDPPQERLVTRLGRGWWRNHDLEQARTPWRVGLGR